MVALAAAAPAPAPDPPQARVAAALLAVDEARLKLPDPTPPAEDDVWLVSDGPDPAASAAPTDELWPAGRDTNLSRDDICKQTGIDEGAMAELESFGLLPGEEPDGYGPEALRIAQACAGFFAYGVEPRHLKMYKRFADQEAAILQQVVPPASAKDPGAAAKAADALNDLARLGAALRLSMLRVGIGPPPRGTGGVPRQRRREPLGQDMIAR